MNANDHVPMVHILPFGLCKKGMPCMPVTPLAWVDVNKKHIIEGAPALTEDSKLACFHGGVITIVPLDAGSAEEGDRNENAEDSVESIAAEALDIAAGVFGIAASILSKGKIKPSVKMGAKKNIVNRANTKFGDNCDNHLAKVEGFSQKRGISGGHNLEEFESAISTHNAKVVKEIPHPTIEGIKEVEYRIPTLDAAGNPTGGYKATSFNKTVYDPKVISDAQMADWGKQAAQEAMASGRIGANGRVWEGFAPNGLKFRGYIGQDGAITNFFPTLN